MRKVDVEQHRYPDEWRWRTELRGKHREARWRGGHGQTGRERRELGNGTGEQREVRFGERSVDFALHGHACEQREVCELGREGARGRAEVDARAWLGRTPVERSAMGLRLGELEEEVGEELDRHHGWNSAGKNRNAIS
jgi:hypothetical protein